MDHKFGGEWTEIKLERLQKYLNFYTTALRNIAPRYGWDLMYIDAFAGTGKCTIQGKSDPIDGSARIALQATPPFDKYIFIDKDEKHINALNSLISEHPEKYIHVYNDDANLRIVDICKSTNWKSARAIMFLDPYGMEVKWSTLEEISKTQAVDMWYLFPLSGLYRQATRKYVALDKGKEKALDNLLGTSEWRSAFYEPPAQQDLFDMEPSAERCMQWEDMVRYVREERLKSVFPEVSQPLILRVNGIPRFALFFAVSNPGQSAIGLSMRVANHILKS